MELEVGVFWMQCERLCEAVEAVVDAPQSSRHKLQRVPSIIPPR